MDTRVNLHGITNAFGIYATDTIRLRKDLAFTVSGRFNHAGIQNIDRLPVTDPEARGSLNGNYTFDRFNPSAGLVYTPVHFASVYFSYSEANRAPTAIELGCADPDAALQSAQRPGGRSALEAGGGPDLRSRRSQYRREQIELARRLVPRAKHQRHPVRRLAADSVSDTL